MKLIKEADPNIRPWWVGCELACGKCGQVIELELNDCQLQNFSINFEVGQVRLICSTCDEVLILDKAQEGDS